MAPENAHSSVDHNMPRPLKAAINRRTVAISQIERAAEFEKRIAADISLTCLEELKIRIQALDEAFTSFRTEQSNIEELDPDEYQRDQRAKYEEIYYATAASLKSKATAMDTAPKETFGNVRLPEIDLPTFSGDITTWLTWFETFSAIIDANPNLSSLSKFHYLIAKLSPSARAPIAGIKIEADNYEEALKTLRERYENKKVIAQEHILRIFNYPRLLRSSASDIRALMDSINNHLNCLRNLERPVDQWDDMIVTIVLFKLDQASLAGWNEAAPVDRLPTLSELFEFLKKRCLKVEGFALTQPHTSMFSTFSAPPFNHGTLFGQAQSTTSAGFGSVGQTNQSSLFGSATTALAQPTGGTDTPTYVTTSKFLEEAQPTGGTHGTLFGQAQSTTSAGFGSVGQTNQSSLFGSATTALAQPTGGTDTPTDVTTSKFLEEVNELPKRTFNQSASALAAIGASRVIGFGPYFGQTKLLSTTCFGSFDETNPTIGQPTVGDINDNSSEISETESLTTNSFDTQHVLLLRRRSPTSTFGQPTTGTLTAFEQQTDNSSNSNLIDEINPTTDGPTSSTSTFGQPTPGTLTAFEQPTVNSNNGTLIGQTNPTTDGPTSSTNTYGQPTTGTVFPGNTIGTVSFKYCPTIGTDTQMRGGTSNNIHTKQHCITAMKEYEAKSLEELRFEDKLAEQKLQSTSLFDQPASSSESASSPQTIPFELKEEPSTGTSGPSFAAGKPLGLGLASTTKMFSIPRQQTPSTLSENENASNVVPKLETARVPTPIDKISALGSVCPMKLGTQLTSRNCSILKGRNNPPFTLFFRVANTDGCNLHEIATRRETNPLPPASHSIFRNSRNGNKTSNSESETIVPAASQDSNKSENGIAPFMTGITNRQRSKSFSGILANKFKDATTKYRELGLYPNDFTKVYQPNHPTM